VATPPFGAVLEAAIKEEAQGARQQLASGINIEPRFFCCTSGLGDSPWFPTGIYKDPVAVVTLSTRQACTGDAITADYSLSWSPSSTIATWSITWGDGQVSAGAWPGAGSVAHPLGGYVLAGTYIVTLTVTDLLGATGQDTMEITILACAGPLPPVAPPAAAAPFIVFAACGASGVWYSDDGGLTWLQRSGALFTNGLVYDLKVNPATIPTANKELWAATEFGLFKTVNSGLSWAWKQLPRPPEYGALSSAVVPVAAITIDTVDPERVFVLGHDNLGGTDYVWLFLTEDGGDSWRSVSIGVPGWEAMAAGLNGDSVGIFIDTDGTPLVGCNTCFIATGCEAINRSIQFTGGAWAAFGVGIDVTVAHYLRDPGGTLWACGQMDDTCGVRATGVIRQVAGAWTDVPGHGFAHADSFSQSADDFEWDTWNNRLYVVGQSDTLWAHFEYWNGAVWTQIPGGGIGDAAGTGDADCLAVDASGRVYVGGNFDFANGGATACGNIARFNPAANNWTALGVGGNGRVRALALDDDGIWLYIGGSFTTFNGLTVNRFCRYNTGTGDVEQLGTGIDASVYTIEVVETIVYIGGSFTTDGIGNAANRVATYDTVTQTWGTLGTGMDDIVRDLEYDTDTGILYATGDFLNADGGAVNQVARWVAGQATVPVNGRAHLLDVDSSGQYVYIGLLNASGFPAIVRVSTQLAGLTTLYNPGAGSYGGVRRDPFHSSVVWIFGNFGAASKAIYGQNWGATLTDITDGGWGAGELVRPILPSTSQVLDLVAILNTAQDSVRSWDGGVTWTKQDDTNFPANTAERDFIDHEYVFVHLQLSVGGGVGWFERSTGITANAPITAIQIVE
jgi:hypothetical protein